jgi:hypothetical protein
VKGWKNTLQANAFQKQAGIAKLISDKADFKSKLVTRDKEGDFILIKETIQYNLTVANIYVPNVSIPNFIKETLLDIKT